MRHFFFAIILTFSIPSFGQQLEWIPFYWLGDSSARGKYFDKTAITIPVTLDNLPNKFEMILDINIFETGIIVPYIRPYLDTYGYSELKNKIDTTLRYTIDGLTYFGFREVELKLGNIHFGKRNIVKFENIEYSISIDSETTKTGKIIGIIGQNLFKDKILIIDYPNKRLCVTPALPKKFSKTTTT